MGKKNISIHKKLIFSFLTITIMAGISATLGMIFLYKTNKDYNRALNNYGFSQGDIGRIGMEVEYCNALVRDLIILTENSELDETNKKIEESMVKIYKIMPKVRNICINDEEIAIYEEMEQALDKFQNIINQVYTLKHNGQAEEALTLFRGQGNSDINEIVDCIYNLLDYNVSMGNNLSDSLVKLERITFYIMLICIVVIMVVSVLCIKHVTKIISKPIQEIAAISEDIAKGNLDVHIKVESEDEIGQLAFYLNKVMDYLNETFAQIKESSCHVASGAEQVSASGQELAQGATNQAQSIITLSSTLMM